MAMHHEIINKSRSADGHEARQNLLLEWAGKRPPPADPDQRPAMERFWRLQTTAGDSSSIACSRSWAPSGPASWPST